LLVGVVADKLSFIYHLGRSTGHQLLFIYLKEGAIAADEDLLLNINKFCLLVLMVCTVDEYAEVILEFFHDLRIRDAMFYFDRQLVVDSADKIVLFLRVVHCLQTLFTDCMATRHQYFRRSILEVVI